MSSPIVNPAFFYLAEAASEFKILFYALGILTPIISAIVYLSTDCETPKNIKLYVISGIVLIIFGALTPSKETCYKMGIAKYVTPQNINVVSKYIDEMALSLSEGAKDTIKEIMDYTTDFVYDIRNNERSDTEEDDN